MNKDKKAEQTNTNKDRDLLKDSKTERMNEWMNRQKQTEQSNNKEQIN